MLLTTTTTTTDDRVPGPAALGHFVGEYLHAYATGEREGKGKERGEWADALTWIEDKG
jgi:hypothetical protein